MARSDTRAAVRTDDHAAPSAQPLTIGRLARGADVGVETVRYYQRRGLLPVPGTSGDSAFRHYPPELVERIRFIKRAQDVGFNLDEIAALLRLENSADRAAIRKVAAERLAQLRARMTELQRMEDLLSHLIDNCAHTGSNRPCPIIDAFGSHGAVVAAPAGKRAGNKAENNSENSAENKASKTAPHCAH